MRNWASLFNFSSTFLILSVVLPFGSWRVPDFDMLVLGFDVDVAELLTGSIMTVPSHFLSFYGRDIQS